MSNYKKLIDLLIEKRKELKLTQNQLSNKVNVSHTTIGRIESGEMNPTISNFIAIADCLGYDIVLKEKEETIKNVSKPENVIQYYALCNKLKHLIRTGWKDWNVKSDRLESVAEHIYGVQMLAIAMYSEYQYDIDLKKVLFMLAIHEIGEIVIGDLTLFQISKEEKEKIEHEAIKKVLGCLLDKEELYNLILEFDKRETKEAKFAYFCDKLECDLQSKLYDEDGCVDLNDQEGNYTKNDAKVQELLNSGMSFSEMWLTFSQRRYNYDENFKEVSNYALTHKIKQ